MTIPAHLLAPRSVTSPLRTPADAEAWLSEVAVGLGDGYYLIWHYSKRLRRFVGFDAYLPDRSAPIVSVRTGDVHAT